jgi:deoxyribose-phosphate aldolase
MDGNTTETRTPLTTFEQLAKMIDHSLLRPELTDQQVVEGLDLAKLYGVASATVRPCDLDLAVRLLAGSGVKPGSVAGFPHGSSTTPAKLYEIRDLLRRGAREIDLVVNYGKLLSRQFQYVESEVLQAVEACSENEAILKLIFENAYLTDELKIIACRICERTGVNFAKTSTGYAPTGYTVADVRLMRAHLPDTIAIKAAHGLRTLDVVLEAYENGCTRIGATATAAILDEWKRRLASATAGPAPEEGPVRA